MALAPAVSAQTAKSRMWSAPAYPTPAQPGPAAPDTQARARGVRTHDGVYLRLQLGASYTSLSSSINGADRSLAGLGTGLGIAIGGALDPHVILYGTFIDSTAVAPHRTLGGDVSDGPHGRIRNVVENAGFGSARVLAAGPGVAYYLDSNLFVAGSLLGSMLFVQDLYGGFGTRSNLGLTFEGQVGKEWWVSDNWALGLSGRALLGLMKDQPLSNESVTTLRLAAFSLLFSATFN